ncbi:MAG: hypothetical protein MJZ20_07740 [Bacteroidaceae bacterium]|nr:hypothetical protein [Bacteroidaceae bacterium]
MFESLAFRESVCSKSELELGLIESSILEVDLCEVDNIKNKIIKVDIEYFCDDSIEGAVFKDDLDAYVYALPLGIFQVEECQKDNTNAKKRHVVAYAVDRSIKANISQTTRNYIIGNPDKAFNINADGLFEEFRQDKNGFLSIQKTDLVSEKINILTFNNNFKEDTWTKANIDCVYPLASYNEAWLAQYDETGAGINIKKCVPNLPYKITVGPRYINLYIQLANEAGNIQKIKVKNNNQYEPYEQEVLRQHYAFFKKIPIENNMQSIDNSLEVLVFLKNSPAGVNTIARVWVSIYEETDDVSDASILIQHDYFNLQANVNGLKAPAPADKMLYINWHSVRSNWDNIQQEVLLSLLNNRRLPLSHIYLCRHITVAESRIFASDCENMFDRYTNQIPVSHEVFLDLGETIPESLELRYIARYNEWDFNGVNDIIQNYRRFDEVLYTKDVSVTYDPWRYKALPKYNNKYYSFLYKGDNMNLLDAETVISLYSAWIALKGRFAIINRYGRLIEKDIEQGGLVPSEKLKPASYLTPAGANGGSYFLKELQSYFYEDEAQRSYNAIKFIQNVNNILYDCIIRSGQSTKESNIIIAQKLPYNKQFVINTVFTGNGNIIINLPYDVATIDGHSTPEIKVYMQGDNILYIPIHKGLNTLDNKTLLYNYIEKIEFSIAQSANYTQDVIIEQENWSYNEEERLFDMSENTLLNSAYSADVPELVEVLMNKLNAISFLACEINIHGNPALEAGDTISIVSAKDTFNTYVLTRELTGIQTLNDMITSKGE